MGVLDELNVYHDGERHSAALNMAMDEALLETCIVPAIRFYDWVRPALSFGYFGKFDEAASQGDGRDLIRRWTGGGIVLHGADLTYSIVVPATHHYSARSAHTIYSDVHTAIRNVLIENGLPAILANATRPRVSESCFANPVWADVLIESRKIAGAAQRRTRRGLLQQGSIQLQPLTADFAARFARALCSSAHTQPLDKEMVRRAREIEEQKYATHEWLQKR
jgi:lipoyl(octanoyl) transferase